MATIKDLAAKTGYAVGTVSRVLNNHPNVSEKARRAILQAVEETGFQLNVNAKQLKQSHATSVLVVVRGNANEIFQQMVETIQTELSRTRYPLYVDYMDETGNEVLRALQLCREKKPLGILFLGGDRNHFREDFSQIDIPCVLVTGDASELDFPNLSSVSTDDALAAGRVVDTLVELGHRRFALIGGHRTGSDPARLRYEGCVDAFERHGIPFDPERDYEQVRFSWEGGYQAVNRLLDRGSPFTALVAQSDVMAVGAIRALNDRGLRVPEDVSVMGYDGLALGSYLNPRLSTVAQSVERLACRAVEILLDCVEHETGGRHERVEFRILLRESTREPAENRT